jgi:hypothetical protein
LFYAIKKISTDAAVDVATASTLIVAENSRRKLLTIVNASDQDIWLRFQSPAEIGKGIFVSAGGFTLEIGDGNLWVGPIYGIHDGAGLKKVSVTELE